MICLVSFVNELVNFFDPIINPLPVEFTEQMKEQAIEAVRDLLPYANTFEREDVPASELMVALHRRSSRTRLARSGSGSRT